MRSSLVGLQLLLACVLVWGTSAVKENKECCGPDVPPEKSCCPKDNSAPREAEKQEKKPAVPAEPNPEEPGKQEKKLWVPEDPDLEELEESAKEYRERMQWYSHSIYDYMTMKEQILDYFLKRRGALYRPIEDTDIKAKYTVGTTVTFTQYLVNTNCTKEEGRIFSTRWDAFQHRKCVALPKDEQKKLKCTVQMFIDAEYRHSTVVRQDCEPVVFWEESDDTVNLDHLLNYLPEGFGPSF